MDWVVQEGHSWGEVQACCSQWQLPTHNVAQQRQFVVKTLSLRSNENEPQMLMHQNLTSGNTGRHLQLARQRLGHKLASDLSNAIVLLPEQGNVGAFHWEAWQMASVQGRLLKCLEVTLLASSS